MQDYDAARSDLQAAGADVSGALWLANVPFCGAVRSWAWNDDVLIAIPMLVVMFAGAGANMDRRILSLEAAASQLAWIIALHVAIIICDLATRQIDSLLVGRLLRAGVVATITMWSMRGRIFMPGQFGRIRNCGAPMAAVMFTFPISWSLATGVALLAAIRELLPAHLRPPWISAGMVR